MRQILERLVQKVSRLPGLGPRSARRVVLSLFKNNTGVQLHQALGDALAHIHPCTRCGYLDEVNPCHLCTDPSRDPHQLCVVADVADIWALERTGAYRGKYHSLGGVLSALNGVGPDKLRIGPLLKRFGWDQECPLPESPLPPEPAPQEVIMALPPTLEGATTIHYMAELLRPFSLKVTTLARGIPISGELEWLDEGTLTAALMERRES